MYRITLGHAITRFLRRNDDDILMRVTIRSVLIDSPFPRVHLDVYYASTRICVSLVFRFIRNKIPFDLYVFWFFCLFSSSARKNPQNVCTNVLYHIPRHDKNPFGRRTRTIIMCVFALFRVNIELIIFIYLLFI